LNALGDLLTSQMQLRILGLAVQSQQSLALLGRQHGFELARKLRLRDDLVGPFAFRSGDCKWLQNFQLLLVEPAGDLLEEFCLLFVTGLDALLGAGDVDCLRNQRADLLIDLLCLLAQIDDLRARIGRLLIANAMLLGERAPLVCLLL
jgi:hypothetical protein